MGICLQYELGKKKDFSISDTKKETLIILKPTSFLMTI